MEVKQTRIEHTEDGAVRTFKGLDDALKFLAGRDEIQWTPEEERAIVRKIDFWLLPLMIIGGIVVYMDSQSFGSAAIFGMIKDLKLFTVVHVNPTVTETSRYSWASSISSFGSVVSQYPLLLLAQKLPLGKFAGCVIVYSGFFAIMMVVAKDFAGTMVLRFLYGFQVVGTPINVILTAMWWKTDEQAIRVPIWFAGAPFGALVGQAFSYGAVQIGGAYKNSPWKWIYILIGSMSIGFGIIFLILYPDSPMKARFLTDRERHIAVLRLRSNNTGLQTREFKKSQVWDTIKDPQTWIFALIKFSIGFANICFGNFAALLLNSSGYSTLKSITMLMPASAIILVVMLLSGWLVKHFKLSRCLVACGFLVPSIVGYVVLWKLAHQSRAALLGGLYTSVFFYGAYIQSVSLLASNVAGHTKKTTMNAIIVSLAYVGAIVGPFSFKGQEAAQGYPTGISTVLAMLCICMACFILLFAYYSFKNKRNIAYLEGHPDLPSAEELAFMDLSDNANYYFRYTT